MSYQTDLNPPEKINEPTRDKIITQLYGRNDLKIIIKKIAQKTYLIEELTAELFLAICKLPEETLVSKYLLGNEDREQLDYWIIGALYKMFNYKDSTFYRKIKKHEIGQSMTAEQREKLLIAQDSNSTEKNLYRDALETSISKLKEYDRNAIQLYFELGTYKAVSERTGIRPEYVSQIVKRVKNELKVMIQEDIARTRDQEIVPEEKYGYDQDQNNSKWDTIF